MISCLTNNLTLIQIVVLKDTVHCGLISARNIFSDVLVFDDESFIDVITPLVIIMEK